MSATARTARTWAGTRPGQRGRSEAVTPRWARGRPLPTARRGWPGSASRASEQQPCAGVDAAFDQLSALWVAAFVVNVVEQVGAGKDRKSVGEGRSVSVSVDLGGRRIIKKNKKTRSSKSTDETI